MENFALLKEDTFEESLGEILQVSQKNEKHTILLVDDEVNNLQLLRRTLRHDYNILTASNGKEALEIVEGKGKEIALIVSDQKMPEMEGTEFLKRVAGEYPDIIKILLTGHLDVDAIVDSINDCHLYQYIVKPFDPEELKLTIETGIQKFISKALPAIFLICGYEAGTKTAADVNKNLNVNKDKAKSA